MRDGCSATSLLCQLLGWLVQHIEITITITVTISIIYVICGSCRKEGYKDGFTAGIAHYIQSKAYDCADIPEKYAGDEYVMQAKVSIEKKLKPKLPSEL
jgi:hypothetical protein